MESRHAASAVGITILSFGLAIDLSAQSIPTYQDETATRLVAAPSLGVADVEEKDYVWGDVDQDGDVDLVCVRKQPWDTPGRRRNVLFMNEGIAEGHPVNGVLIDRSLEYASAADDGGQGFLDLTNDRDVALVDVDGDGWLDLITATTYGSGLPKTISHPRVYRNLGDDLAGAWLGYRYEESRTPTMPIAPNFCAVGFGDVTGDGAPDVYFVDYLNTLEDRLWINDGTGTYVDESTSRMTAAMLESDFGVRAVIADMNGDGVRDVVKDRALTAPIQISIAYNDPADVGFFGAFESVYLGSSYHVEVGDLNSDGLQDIVIDDDGIDRYLLNQGNGPDGLANFSTLMFPPQSDGFGGNIVIRDLDKDGFQDVLIADVDVDCCGCSRHLHIWRNLGNLPNVTFVEETGAIPVSARTGTHDIAVFDLNGDTWLDLVIGTCTGTSVWIADPPIGVHFEYPSGIPDPLLPDTATELVVDVQVVGSALGLSAVTLFSAMGSAPFAAHAMSPLGGSLFSAELPAAPCGESVRFYIEAVPVEGGIFNDPPDAPSVNRVSSVASSFVTLLSESFEGVIAGWTVIDDPSLDDGTWEVAIPTGTSWNGEPAAPGSDAGDGSDLRAFITDDDPAGGVPTASDVDGGPTSLITPPIAIAGQDARVQFDVWVASALGTPDALTVALSIDDGANWVPVTSIATTTGEWETRSFLIGSAVLLAESVRVRFSIRDAPNDSITEAGIDNVSVVRTDCGTPYERGDCNDDGSIDLGDAISSLGVLFGGGVAPPCNDSCDANDDGAIDIADAVWMLVALFGGGPAPQPGCGVDPTADALDCASFGSCP